MVGFISLALSSLFLDVENPRLDNPQESQVEAVRALISASKQKQKLVSLAKDIALHGINPSEAMIVTASGTNQYVVLEGNRRLAAIKLLENPDSFKGLFSDKVQTTLQRLSREYQKKPIQMIQCVIARDRDEARHWIELRHEGEQGGAGVVRWGTIEAARFRQIYGQKEIHLQVLDFLQDQGLLEPEERHGVPITSVKRVVEDAYAREKLGYEINRGEFIPGEDKLHLASLLKRVVDDISSGRKKVRDIYHKEDRIGYIDELLKDQDPLQSDASNTPEVVDSGTPDISGPVPPEPVSPPAPHITCDEVQATILAEAQGSGTAGGTPTLPGTGAKRSISLNKNRLTLIPQRTIIRIPQARINEIYSELRRLPYADYINAAAVLFRVFLELSIDEYIRVHQPDFQKSPDDNSYRLGKKLEEVAQHLVDAKKLSDQQVKPVKRAAQKDHFVAGSITTMNQYVHNAFFKPSPDDIRIAWDTLEPFILKLWE